MNQLSLLLAEIQRDAAALPTGELRTEIQHTLGVLTMCVDEFQSMRPGAASLEEMISTTGDVITVALITALYVRELTTRPAPRFAQVRLGFN